LSEIDRYRISLLLSVQSAIPGQITVKQVTVFGSAWEKIIGTDCSYQDACLLLVGRTIQCSRNTVKLTFPSTRPLPIPRAVEKQQRTDWLDNELVHILHSLQMDTDVIEYSSHPISRAEFNSHFRIQQAAASVDETVRDLTSKVVDGDVSVSEPTPTLKLTPVKQPAPSKARPPSPCASDPSDVEELADILRNCGLEG
jgi:hypothetical protein